jgi:hypothetical protein
VSGELSTFRLHALRFVYFFNAVVIGFGAWSELINQVRLINEGKPWDLIYGIAFSLYAGFALLMLWGVRFPVRMLPLILLQILYKMIWLIVVGYALWSAGRLNPAVIGTIEFFASIVVLDLVTIPWPYIFENYLRAMLRREPKSEPSSNRETSAPGMPART